MPLQNRVAPFGEIVAHPARGLFTGNRGIIHDPATRTLLKRRWTTKAWICCTLDWKGRRRKPMAQRSWTELFFLDEATALAAGHRPCFYCRRERAQAFRDAWAKGQGREKASAPEMDVVLHAERLGNRAKRLHPVSNSIMSLPDGTMIATEGKAYLVYGGRLLLWNPQGYRAAGARRVEAMITPPSIVSALASGYRPALHPSASA
ncbi:MAG: hypothetical protein FJX60_16680 [Alphaproteobacteria bacterium]|nr:hypothetical protein [Alphaproteobacteria bacterium]